MQYVISTSYYVCIYVIVNNTCCIVKSAYYIENLPYYREGVMQLISRAKNPIRLISLSKRWLRNGLRRP
jgi:hypothetical protein